MFLDGKKMICYLCSANYRDIFDSFLRLDYTEPGKGKLHEYHICMKCRKNVLDWLKLYSNIIKNENFEGKNYA